MYSLGATLYFLATGAKPLAAGTHNSLLVDDDEMMMPPLCEINQNVSEGFSAVVSSLLKVDHVARPTSWEGFLERLDDFQGAQLSTQILRPDPERIQAAVRARDAAEAAMPASPPLERRKKGRSTQRRRDALRRAISGKAQNDEGTPGWVVLLLVLCVLVLGGLLVTMAVLTR